MKNIKYTIILLLCICTQCKNDKDCHDTITFINKTDSELYVMCDSEYPDTNAFALGPNPILDPNFSKVNANENNKYVLWVRGCWELKYEFLIPSDTLMVYVFDAYVLENTPWDTVVENNLVLKRYDLSLPDIVNNNWSVTFP